MLPLLLSLLQSPDLGRQAFEAACVDCHAGRSAEAGFDIEGLLALRQPATGLFDWRRARAMIETSSMPPDGELNARARRDLLGFLDRVEAQAFEQGGAAGEEPVRRLTRTELGNALERLLGVPVDEAAVLPDERIADGGFEASSATLFVHAEWLERAGALARAALSDALPADASQPASLDLDAVDPERFLRRVYRRPPTPRELGPLSEALRVRDAGARRTAVRVALERAFASPHFLLRLEDAAVEGMDQPIGERPVGPFGLASRLAFLLTAGPPDDALLDHAANGTLVGDVVAQETRRLLAGPHGLEFGRGFGEQWLGTHVLGTAVKPDPIDVPFMTDSVMASMRAEVAHFVRWLFAEGRPLDDLLDSRVTFVDPELARFYGLRVTGPGHRRVQLRDAERRGILGKAAVLAVTAYPERTSPVLRGVWVLDDLLGTPPPPPPPGASELDEDLEEELFEDGPRGVLRRHRAKKECAACHERIDPLGFGLEGFDQYGRRRHDAEASGVLPSGREFEGARELSRALLAERRDDLARQVARRLLALALARPLAWSDERTVIQLAKVLAKDGFEALLVATVNSRPFRYTAFDLTETTEERPR